MPITSLESSKFAILGLLFQNIPDTSRVVVYTISQIFGKNGLQNIRIYPGYFRTIIQESFFIKYLRFLEDRSRLALKLSAS